MKILSFRISGTLDRKLAAAVRRRGVQRSTLAREALEQYLDESREMRRGSFLDVTRDLVGCVKDAPADLSANPRHLADFGE